MATILQFPIDNMSDKDKKIIRLETYIKTSLIDMAEKRRELVFLADKIRRLQLRLATNGQPDGNN